MKRIILIMLVLLMMNAANAQILTTGSVNIRSGPGLEYDVIGSVDTGKVLILAEQTLVLCCEYLAIVWLMMVLSKA